MYRERNIVGTFLCRFHFSLLKSASVTSTHPPMTQVLSVNEVSSKKKTSETSKSVLSATQEANHNSYFYLPRGSGLSTIMIPEMISNLDVPLSVKVFVPFWLSVYTISYLRNSKKNKNHFTAAPISNLHALVGIGLAIAGLYLNDESLLSEMTLLAWGMGYFCADFLDCIARRDPMFFAHAIVGLALFRASTMSPFYEIRTGSMGYFVEASNPCYNLWNNHRSKANFRNFVITFFLCRIVYTPIFLWRVNTQTKGALLQSYFAMAASLAFYAMNFVWFVKGVQMYLKYDDKKKPKTKQT